MSLFVLLLMLFSDPSECLKLIESGNISEAKQIYTTLKDNGTESKQFLDAYFSRNAESAILTYQHIYSETKKEFLKRTSKNKLYEYYFAKGLYLKAEEFKSTEKTTPIVAVKNEEQPKKAYFSIQVGVFSAESNALALKQKIDKLISDKVFIKHSTHKGTSVVTVLVGEYSTRDNAHQTLQQLQDRLGVNGWIKEIK